MDVYALIKPDGTVLDTVSIQPDMSLYPGYRLLPVKNFIVDLHPAPFGIIPSDAVDVSASYFQSDLDHWRKRQLAAKISAIKEEARQRILAVAPDYKQANLTARAAELALLYPGTPIAELPDAIRAEVEAGMAIWSRIKEIREASNAIEIALLAFADAPDTTATDVAAWDVTVGWP